MNVPETSYLYAIEAEITKLNSDKSHIVIKAKKEGRELTTEEKELVDKIDSRMKTIKLIKADLTVKNTTKDYTRTREQEEDTLLKMAKQRKEDIDEYTSKNRPDLVEIEQAELDIINEFAPQLPSEEDIIEFTDNALTEYHKAQGEGYVLSMRDMGKLKPIVLAKYPKADGSLIKKVLEKRINS
jgi:uncharacterized protein YqeY